MSHPHRPGPPESDREPELEARRRLCQELAESLATPEGLRQARLLQAGGLLARPAPEAEPEPLPRPPLPIGIWSPVRERDGGLAWVRPDPHPLGDHWAAVKTLRPKRDSLPLRVALFGESVAAGYLYAPHLTPARVLEGILRHAGGADRFEVIDLARTNERLSTLAETVRASLQIQPDVLVLFAGNNWNLLETPEVSPWAASVEARQRFARALREGPGGPGRLAAERLRAAARRAFDLIGTLARQAGIPAIAVVPEVNRADWETRQPAPWLPEDGTARWYELYRRAAESRNPEQVQGLAERLLELDGGACPTSWRLLARSLRARGDEEGAARAARAEVDAAAYPGIAFLAAPQAGGLAREVLEEARRRHHFSVVDLPAVFAEHAGSPLPGRRLFLDYCHLTAEGIQVAMAAVAEEVFRLSGMVEDPPTWRSLVETAPGPEVSPEADAVAKLGAAIHTAHRLLSTQPRGEILEHWCEAALDASPGIAGAMVDLVAARTAPLPEVLTAAQGRNLASPYRLLLQHGWRWDHLDADLIEAILRTLRRRDPAAADEAESRLLERSLSGSWTDLSHPYWLWDPLERFYPEAMEFEDLAHRAVYRAAWPESAFAVVVEERSDVELTVTARLPAFGGAPRRGTVEVGVGGEAAARFEVSERWTREGLTIPLHRMRPGLNRLTLRWPEPPPDGEAARRRAVERLEVGIAADLHPVFGELFALRARADRA
jgi:hypothetical protein